MPNLSHHHAVSPLYAGVPTGGVLRLRRWSMVYCINSSDMPISRSSRCSESSPSSSTSKHLSRNIWRSAKLPPSSPVPAAPSAWDAARRGRMRRCRTAGVAEEEADEEEKAEEGEDEEDQAGGPTKAAHGDNSKQPPIKSPALRLPRHLIAPPASRRVTPWAISVVTPRTSSREAEKNLARICDEQLLAESLIFRSLAEADG